MPESEVYPPVRVPAICSLRGPILAPEARRRSLAEGGLSLQIVASGGIGVPNMQPDWYQSREWLEATRAIRIDPNASIPCPECRRCDLRILDFGQPRSANEIYLCCHRCAASNFSLFGRWDGSDEQLRALTELKRLRFEYLPRKGDKAHSIADQPTSEARRRWHAAPDILQRNPKAAVLCPQCGRGNLSLYLHGPKEAPVEKTTACQACGAYEVFVCAWWDYEAQRQEAIHAWVRRLAEGHPD